MKFITVIKLDGTKEPFEIKKIIDSVSLAAKKVGDRDPELAKKVGRKVLLYLEKTFPNKKEILTSVLGEAVEKALIQEGHAETAKEFILHRENKKHLRQDKNSLGIVDDLNLSYNTLYILKQRYLKRDEKDNILETPKQMIKRIAVALAGAEKTESLKRKWYEKFYEVMVNFDFLPGSRTIANAGKEKCQLSNCFVWPLNDDINQVFEILHKSTLIKKYGGGCGYNFSTIRPEGDIVGNIPNLAAGPVKMMQMFDLMTSLFKQEGKYESGNMAILNVSHPDIFNFITAKQNDGILSKTNISVGITDEFMQAAISGKDWDLINPRTNEVVQNVSAKSILDLMANLAYQTGDPGIVNLSAINRGTALANPLLKKRGRIQATNPCGEVPLYPYESCNLGYLNFTKFITSDKKFDFKRLQNIMPIAVRLMDNVIDVSWFPVEEISESVRNHRRIGIGCVGWAETLAILGIPYDSKDALNLAENVVSTMYKSAFSASIDLAKEKGPFPYITDSIWVKSSHKPRNVALLTFPPSSSNAVICDTSFGIEPYFALAYEQNVLGGMRLRSINKVLIERLKEEGIYSSDIEQKIIDNHGSIQGIRGIPKKLKDVFKTAHDINWRDHIRMQAAFQKYTDNAITKTINMPASATPKDIKEAYILAWKLGCKGLTVYRDKTKQNQVFEFGHKSNIKKCPDCGMELVNIKGCLKCKCGFSVCEL